MTNIVSIHGLEILDSRGCPTLLAEVRLKSGAIGQASVPSGASVGSREACELRDGDQQRFAGKGVLRAVQYIDQNLQDLLVGRTSNDQKNIDKLMLELDGSADKHVLGANAILAVSLAVAHATANERREPLYRYLAKDQKNFQVPVPLINIINGGVHASNNLSIQEFMIVPVGLPDFSTALRCSAEIFATLRSLLLSEGFNVSVGDEGGFSLNLANHHLALDWMLKAIEKAGYRPGEEVALALDVAASEFYQDGLYLIEGKTLDSDQMVDYLVQLTARYPLISIEDGMAEQDIRGWKQLSKALRNKIQLVGDDLFATQVEWLEQGIGNAIANAILIKPNQVGSLSETLATIAMAQQSNYATVISHRSGETTDTTIADLAVATCAGQIKTGSMCRGERIAKYNRLLYIIDQLQEDVIYPGWDAFSALHHKP